MLKVIVPAKLDSLSFVNEWLGTALPEAFKSLQPQVELALEELLVNTFSYAYANQKVENEKDGEALISAHTTNFDGLVCFCLRVQDWGQQFDPFLEAPEPDITLDADARPIGGLGVFLIKSIVTHYSYSYIDNSNCIELYFALPV